MSEIFDTSIVTDMDTPFVVDAKTREITNKRLEKKVLMQNDHNAERFTFEIPRYIEGRDIALCNVIQVLYTNVEGKSRKQATGVYTIEDFRVYPFYDDVMVCSWLISQNATQYEGNLSFMLRFAQVNDDATVKYSWHTKIFSEVYVSETLNSPDIFEYSYVDVIQQWKNTVMAELSTYVEVTVKENVNVAQIDVNKQNISELTSEQATLKSRMDAFTALGEGSTTGDAELQDIRVGFDGKKYSNAGDAVREQISIVQDQIMFGTVCLNEEPIYNFKQGEYAELTLPGNAEIFCNGTVYTVTDATTRFDHTIGYTLFNIIFNYSDKTIGIQYFRTDIPKNSVIIGQAYLHVLNLRLGTVSFYGVNRIDGYNPIDINVWCQEPPTMVFTDNVHISLNVPECYVNTGYIVYGITKRTIEYDSLGPGIYNLLYNRVTDDMYIAHRTSKIPMGHQRLGVIHTNYGVFLNGTSYLSNVNNLALAPLILGADNKYVEFDTTNQTITFPHDTLIQNNRAYTWSKMYYQLSASKGNNVVSYSKLGTSAIVVYYDTLTDTLGVTPYNQILLSTTIPIASFRTVCGQVSINAPYKFNGKPFNMSISEFGADIPTIADLKNDFMVKSVNHRGYCQKAPENTLSAYKLSAKNGFSYAECDVSFTSDNIPVLLHDSTIDRTSNGTGNITELTLDQVRAYDFGSWFDSKYTGEKIPTFEEFIALCRKLSIHPYIEIKSSAAYTQEQIDILVNIVKRYGMTGKVTYISFEASYLEYVKNTDPDARLGYVVGEISEAIITRANELKTETNEVFIDANYGVLTTDMVTLCMNADLPLEVWTCNSADHINNTLDQYVSGVTSDNVHAGKTLFENNL